MKLKARSSLPSRVDEDAEYVPSRLNRSTTSRALQSRPENLPSPAPMKRKTSWEEDEWKPKRVKASDDEVEILEVEARDVKPRDVKPSKLQVGKDKTVARRAKKADFESASIRWIWKHRHLFAALLPHHNHFMEYVKQEIKKMPSKEDSIEREEFEKQPDLVTGGEMKDYQLAGLSFLVWMYRNGMNAILGDEMGLGKTLQTLSLLAYIKEQDERGDPHLVICPMSVITSWVSEAARWVPSLRALRFHGPEAERDRLKNNIKDGMDFDLVITTYESYKAEHRWFKSRRWNYCILDEGHRIKSAESMLAQSLQGLGSAFRLILTGTPVHNNLVELWSLLHWLYPTIFTRATETMFHESFDLTQGRYDVKFIESAQKLMEVIMIRRTKNVVELSVPPKEELTVFIPFTEAQRYWTYKVLTRLSASDLREVFNTSFTDENEGKRRAGGTNQYQRLLNLLMHLRLCCDHPYTLPGAEPEPYELGEHVVEASSKMIVIDKLLKDLIPKGERVLIFSQFISVLDLLEDVMNLRKYRYARLDGGTPRPRRALDIRLFQQENSPYDVFLISTRAGGLGINLTKAAHVIMVDCDWNPQMDAQAIARAHRIGQTKTVKVYKLICRGSVEDQMLDRIRRKLFLSLKIMQTSGSTNGEDASGVKMGELLSILRNGSSALDTQTAAMDFKKFESASIEEILAQSRRKQDIRDAKMKQELEGDTMDALTQADVAEEETRLLSGVAAVRSRLFEGQVVGPQISRSTETSPVGGKRARTNRLVKVNGIESLIQWHQPITAPPPKVKRGSQFEHEEWCLYCQDGGELYMCNTCPRVFHSACYNISDAEARRAPTLQCPQHKCRECRRSTTDAGGMLFRCATCCNAFCEDCLPEGELDAIGDSIPQFTALGYVNKNLAFYIRCNDCQIDPVIRYDDYENKYWEEEDIKPKADKLNRKVKKMKQEEEWKPLTDDQPSLKRSKTAPTLLTTKNGFAGVKQEPLQLPSPGGGPSEPALLPSSKFSRLSSSHGAGKLLFPKRGSSALRTPVSELGEMEVIDLTED